MSNKQNDIYNENIGDFLFEQGRKILKDDYTEMKERQPSLEELKEKGFKSFREAREAKIIV